MLPEKEFIELIDQNAHIIHQICNLYMHNKDDRQDLFQEIILNAWKGSKQFRKEAKFSTWLYRVALNTAITMFKKERRHQEVKTSVPVTDTDEPSSGQEALYLAMVKAVAELSDIEKALVMLYFEGCTHDEIASITGITANNVAVKMNRLKTKLREKSRKFL